MEKKGMDVLLVRKSGPVQAMTFRTWWIYFLFLVLLCMLAGMAAGSYLLYGQQEALKKLSDDTRLIMLRTERLEALVQEQETREVLAMQAAMEKQEAAPKPIEPKVKKQEQPKVLKTKEIEPQPEEVKKTEVDVKPKEKTNEPKPEAKAVETQKTEPPAKEPETSEQVAIRNVKSKMVDGKVHIGFDIVNKSVDTKDSQPAMGYVSAILKGKKNGKSWMEAWPPMRLTPAGRPLNYRRGAPYSIQRFRRMHAKYDLTRKEMTQLEIVVYSREGSLLLVRTQEFKLPTESQIQESNKQMPPSDNKVSQGATH